jgi:hypothetical protein
VKSSALRGRGMRRVAYDGPFGTAVNPSLEASRAPSLARTIPKGPAYATLRRDVCARLMPLESSAAQVSAASSSTALRNGASAGERTAGRMDRRLAFFMNGTASGRSVAYEGLCGSVRARTARTQPTGTYSRRSRKGPHTQRSGHHRGSTFMKNAALFEAALFDAAVFDAASTREASMPVARVAER